MGFIALSECREITATEKPIDYLLKNGLIILDKWSGPTSRDVMGVLKKVMGLNKAGHSGTLDPPASGMLPVLIENATKAIPALQGHDKEYMAVVHLHGEASEDKIREKLAEFIGTIKQKPPVRSAVARRVRERNVYSAELLQKEGRNILIKVRCEAGTYIRLIAHDLGKKLEFGAHLKELRRIGVGNFTEADMVTMEDVEKAIMLYKQGDDSLLRKVVRPLEDSVLESKKIYVKDNAIKNIMNGAPVFSTGICKASSNIRKGDLVAIMSLDEYLIALGTAKKSVIEMKQKGTAVKTDRVM